jgi:glucan phosphoethanolaminetransferase (alkaline phosphatase superfamily)
MTAPNPADAQTARQVLPKYGEYAPPGYVSPVAPSLGKDGTPAAPRRSTKDSTATTLLLALGSLVTTMVVFGAFALNQSMQSLYTSNGLGSFEPNATSITVQIVLGVSHPIALAIAYIVSTRRIRRGLRSFWVPLVAGASAAVVYFTATFALFLSDAPLFDALMRAQQGGLG